jgi:starch phosphorylase
MHTSPRSLPPALEPLAELALDLRWTWSHGGDGLWRRADPGLWEQTGNPWLLLRLLPAERLRTLAADESFLAELAEQVRRRRAALESPAWFERVGGAAPGTVAYFSMEFGLHEALPLYAGGLGILAGDHLKTASDLGVPLVGVGILWQQGYFRQALDAAGRQHELYPHNDPENLPIQPLRTAEGDRMEVSLEMPGRRLHLRAGEAAVGRTRLYLLDSNHPLNAPVDRGLTGSLYGGDPEVRLLQELILGIGGWRLLRALGCEVEVCHLNEGHAAFLVVERARSFMQDHGVDFREALWATRAANVFTTHTSVAAGFDAFEPALIERYTTYFGAYVRRLGITWPELLALGRREPENPGEPFGMAYLAVRGSARVNAVSRLHGEVSRRLFQGLFPRWPEHEVPVSHVTNGVHVPSWDSADADALWTAAAGKERWRDGPRDLGAALATHTDEQLWSMRARERADVVRVARTRMHRQLAQRGAAADERASVDGLLDPEALTIGFARRFTAYKRPNLLLADPERLTRLLTNPARPLQLVISGKAHPADEEGKRFVADWLRFAARPDVRSRVVFLEDYDMALAKELVEGVDVWLNTPLRPWEASGTSGMKVLVNGGLNLSVLDGWWAEAYEPGNGWALGDGREAAGAEHDARDAEELYRLLEEEIVPEFYDRDAEGVPRRWLQRVRTSMAALTPRFSSNRMLRQYVEEAYLPAARDFRDRAAEGARLARDLAAWETRLRAGWGGIAFGPVEMEGRDGTLHVRAEVSLGELPRDGVRVELYADAREGEPAVREPLAIGDAAPDSSGRCAVAGTLKTHRAPGEFTLRVVPYHPSAHLPIELPLIAWQR